MNAAKSAFFEGKVGETAPLQKILYLHGYGSSPEKSRTRGELERLTAGRAEVAAPQLSPHPLVSMKAIEGFLENISLVVAVSYGGFFAMQLKGIPRIVVNPCMRPSTKLTGVEGITKDIEDALLMMEKAVYSPSDMDIVGLFSTDDELFSFKEDFAALYGYERTITVQDGAHRLTPEEIEQYLLPLVNKALRV